MASSSSSFSSNGSSNMDNLADRLGDIIEDIQKQNLTPDDLAYVLDLWTNNAIVLKGIIQALKPTPKVMKRALEASISPLFTYGSPEVCLKKTTPRVYEPYTWYEISPYSTQTPADTVNSRLWYRQDTDPQAFGVLVEAGAYCGLNTFAKCFALPVRGRKMVLDGLLTLPGCDGHRVFRYAVEYGYLWPLEALSNSLFYSVLGTSGSDAFEVAASYNDNIMYEHMLMLGMLPRTKKEPTCSKQ